MAGQTHDSAERGGLGAGAAAARGGDAAAISLGLGFSAKAIEHRLANGRLHPIARGVYAGRATASSTREGRWMAAVLACGDGAVLSHRSAAALWGIGCEERGRIDVTIRRGASDARSGIRVAQPSVPARATSLDRRGGIPVTHPVQTLIDLATELEPAAPRARGQRGRQARPGRPRDAPPALDDHAGEPGVRPLRDPPRPPHLPALRRRARTPLPPARRRRRASRCR